MNSQLYQRLGPFWFEPAVNLPSGVLGGVILRSDAHGNPIGSSFWPAGTISPREAQLNRDLLRTILGAERIGVIEQIHGDRIVSRPGEISWNQVPQADAQWTREHASLLLVNVADCCPVLISDDSVTLVASVHCGWRGAAAGIVPKALDRLAVDFQPPLSPANFRVWVGPCADADLYEVGPEVAEQFTDYHDALTAGAGDRSYLDIRAVIVQQLRAAGVPEHLIAVSPGGTISDRRYHSFRRDGVWSGRMAGFIVRR